MKTLLSSCDFYKDVNKDSKTHVFKLVIITCKDEFEALPVIRNKTKTDYQSRDQVE